MEQTKTMTKAQAQSRQAPKPAQKRSVKIEQKALESAPKKTETGNFKNMAIVRVRGVTGIQTPIKQAMTNLCIFRPNFCTVRKATPSIMGAVKKVKDYVTYGEITDETLALLKARSEKLGESADAKFYRLNPPRKGYGRKGIKQGFSRGGALGYRGDKINDLIKRML